MASEQPNPENENPQDERRERQRQQKREYYRKTRDVQIQRSLARYWGMTLAERKAYRRKCYLNTKLAVLRHYSPKLRCVRCGLKDIRALTIDHVNSDGHFHRRKNKHTTIYRWLKRHGYPEGFRVLCMSCQIICFEEFREEKRNEKRSGGTGNGTAETPGPQN